MRLPNGKSTQYSKFNVSINMLKEHFRKKTFSFFLLLFIIIFLSSVYAKNNSSDRKGFLWKVQSNTGTAYIIGSIHAYKSELYPLPRKMEDSFDKSDALAVEANINEAKPESMMTMINGAL
jgi:uncharacterized protein YbaP (TraB family)